MEQAEKTTKTTIEAAAEIGHRIEVEEALSVISTLSGMQRRFLVEYLSAERPNATAAAEKVGYKTPNKQGPRLLKNPKIREAIDEYFHTYEMSAREVIARLSDQARGSLGDFLDIEDGRDPALSLARAKREGKLHLLKKYKQKRVTFVNKDDEETVTEWIEVELHDPQAALVHVGRYHGLFTDRTDITSGGEVIKPNIYLPDNGRETAVSEDNDGDAD